MSWLRLKSSLLLGLCGLLLIASTAVVHAQGGWRIQVSDPQTEGFPNVSLFVRVTDDSGAQVEGLRTTDFQLTEDGTPVLNLIVNKATVGTRLIFALNTDASLRIRDSLGRSRFDLARQALLAWWDRPDFTQLGLDDLTLLDSERVLVAHSDSSAELASVLDNTSPSFSELDTGYELLFRALDFNSEKPPRPGMPSSMIFITSLLRQPRDIPLTNIITRARSTGTAIYPVLIGPVEATDQPELEILQRLAQETGGELTLYDEQQGLSQLAGMIAASREQYELNYTSMASESGPHEIRLQLASGDGEGLSASTSFVLEIQPAEVTLIGIPDSIERATDDPATPPEDIPPTSLKIEYAVRFTDGHTRPIQLSQLIVDGSVVGQSTAAPFDTIEWDISGILQSGTHNLQVAVTDSLGLKGTSPPAQISLEVLRPPGGLSAIRPALGSLLLALAVLVTGVGLASYLISGRKPRLRVAAETTSAPPPKILRGAALQRDLPEEPAEAVLIPVTAGSDLSEVIPLIGMDTILGRDPSLAAIPIEDASVDRLHARLIRQADGEYLIRDQDSTAGTWVNYREIPKSGMRLKHGDLVQLGEVAFRFQYTDPPPPRPVKVLPVHSHSPTNSDEGEQPE
jgi:hypothetical protein